MLYNHNNIFLFSDFFLHISQSDIFNVNGVNSFIYTSVYFREPLYLSDFQPLKR